MRKKQKEIDKMPIYEREKEYIRLLTDRAYKISELSKALYISEPTARRDVEAMKNNGLVECHRGVVRLKTNSPDHRIPAYVREPKNKSAKQKLMHSLIQQLCTEHKPHVSTIMDHRKSVTII